ncbi:YezD family protein [Croceicoccus bisphenolivorans]|uniref:YezD family protein n=1 Tax=Croceicoccus bisphenolivorans TaxID=1783232 RepID=UPI0009ED79EB|nr:YezD family protein [Croceicoccus bisphenolivorans]
MSAFNDIIIENGVGAEQLKVIVEALSKVRFGIIQLTVHDGKLMQLDITERRRFA